MLLFFSNRKPSPTIHTDCRSVLFCRKRRVISLLAIRIPYITEKARGHKIKPKKSDNSSVYRISHSHGQSTLYRKHLDHCLLALP